MWKKTFSKNTKNKPRKFEFSWSFLIAFLFSFCMGNGYLFLLYTFSVILHELFHIFVAVKLGYTLQKFKLSILGASMNLEDESFWGNDEFLIAISGPLLNLFLFLLCLGMWWVFPPVYNFTFDLKQRQTS